MSVIGNPITLGGTAFAYITVEFPSGSTCTCVSGSKTLTATTTPCVFGVPTIGTWRVTSTNGSASIYEDVVITTKGQVEIITLSYVPSWSSGSISDIQTAIMLANEGKVNLADYWSIGDVRNITYNSATYHMRLVHKFTGTPASATAPYALSNGKYPQYMVEITPLFGTSVYMPSSTYQKYFQSVLLNYTNSTIYNGLGSGRELLKSWMCYVGAESNSPTSSRTYNQMVCLASPSSKEYGATNPYNADENNKCVVLDYYSNASTAASRRASDHTGVGYYWLRSPATDMNYRLAGVINSGNGSVLWTSSGCDVQNVNGVTVLGCI